MVTIQYHQGKRRRRVRVRGIQETSVVDYKGGRCRGDDEVEQGEHQEGKGDSRPQVTR